MPPYCWQAVRSFCLQHILSISCLCRTKRRLFFRRDFIDALKATDMPAVRLPGGNFVSAWSWKDSIGPKEERKVRLDPAWHQYITN